MKKPLITFSVLFTGLVFIAGLNIFLWHHATLTAVCLTIAILPLFFAEELLFAKNKIKKHLAKYGGFQDPVEVTVKLNDYGTELDSYMLPGSDVAHHINGYEESLFIAFSAYLLKQNSNHLIITAWDNKWYLYQKI